MDIAGIQPKYFYGLRTCVRNNVHHISEDDILYPVGGVITIHNFAAKRQKYFRVGEKGYAISLIAVSGNKKTIAVAEDGDIPSVSIFDANSLKRKRHLTAPMEKGITTKVVQCMQFTCDFRNLIVIYGEPDWLLVNYKFDRGKIESTTRANNMNNTGTVRDIAPNPNDPTCCVLVGDILFRMLACTESVWRQFGYSKAENIYFRSVCWLTQERILAGTADGQVLMIENGELKLVFSVEDTNSINFVQRGEAHQSSGTQLAATLDARVMDVEVCFLQACPKGFILECGRGKVYLYEKESLQKFKKRNLFILEDDVNNYDEQLTTEKYDKEPKNKINGMSLSPTQDYLIVSCGLSQLFIVYLWGPDITRQPEVKFQELGPNLHRGAIQDIAICYWKPILLTVGRDDQSIHVWNYESNDLIMYRTYQEDIYGVSLHPTGLYALVGFTGKLKFMRLLIDDFAITKEFLIRYCAVCRFSTQGHLFAAVNGNIIQIYSSITFENIFNLKGHNGKITDLSWTVNDYRLLSCGLDGALYEWDMQNGKRVVEVIDKVSQCTGAAISSDGKVSFVVGSDGEIKEVMNGVVRTNQVVDNKGLDCIALSNSDMMMFVSGGRGVLFSIKLPLTEKPERMEYVMHNETVVKLALSFDDKYLISCSIDGTLCIWKLINIMGKAIKIDKDYEPSLDILISYQDLEEKLQLIKDLHLRLNELDTEHSYQVRQIEAAHIEKLAEVHEAYKEAIDNLKDKNSALENEHTQEMNNISIEILKMRRNHDSAIEHLEATYNEKLINEYNKYVNLEDKIVKIRKAYDEQIEELQENNKYIAEEVADEYKKLLNDKDIDIGELREEIQQLEKDHETVKQQIEDDADREIYELKTSHEVVLKEEQQFNIKLRAENGVFQKKLNASFKEIDELKHTIFTLENEHMKFKNVITGLEKDILELKKEITDRDETIQGKEKKIYELKKKTQELEKCKFVLDFKITELKAQIEPRERKIYDQKEEIREMIVELENLQKKIIALELQLQELRERLSASQNEYKREQSKFGKACELIKQMRNDLHYASGLIQDINKLKLYVKDMYHRYNADKEFTIIRQEDCESKNEFVKQREYLEKSIGGLKIAVSKRYDKNMDKLKIMEESTQLISEVNSLRNELKKEQKHTHQMRSLLGVTKKTLKPNEAQRKLTEAVKTREEIRQEYVNNINYNSTCIRELRKENMRLINTICETDTPSTDPDNKCNEENLKK